METSDTVVHAQRTQADYATRLPRVPALLSRLSGCSLGAEPPTAVLIRTARRESTHPMRRARSNTPASRESGGLGGWCRTVTAGALRLGHLPPRRKIPARKMKSSLNIGVTPAFSSCHRAGWSPGFSMDQHRGRNLIPPAMSCRSGRLGLFNFQLFQGAKRPEAIRSTSGTVEAGQTGVGLRTHGGLPVMHTVV
jgi:hypothetical protein